MSRGCNRGVFAGMIFKSVGVGVDSGVDFWLQEKEGILGQVGSVGAQSAHDAVVRGNCGDEEELERDQDQAQECWALT